jgi:light-regulated signal transduction histidine kinase (bacteriophytochrome)
MTESDVLTAELESFSYSISHDLRAPVRAIIGFSRALEDDYGVRLDEEGRRLLAVVVSEAERIDGLIDGLVVFSRLGHQPMEHVLVEMTVLAREVVNERANARPSSDVIIEIADLPSVTGDHVLLRKVWENLISNATKFSSLQPSPRVTIWASQEPTRIVYNVRDNGVGFDMAYSEKLFGIFQKIHGSDKFSGSGLGLAIVKRIVHRHGGAVWADAALGEGATLSFALPIGRG